MPYLSSLAKKTLVLVAACWVFSTWSAFNVYEFENAKQEKQFTTLINELRCPKCQNNNLSDSNAPLATDIKNYVYQSVKSGKSSQDITDFLVSRYGQFVTYRPQNRWVWILPTLIGGLALAIAVWVIAGKRRATETAEDVPDMDSIIRQYEQEQR